MVSPVGLKKFNQLKEQVAAFDDNNEYLKVAVFEDFATKINRFTLDNLIDIEDFEFEDPLHYSSTGKTINRSGLTAILNHFDLIEEIIKSNVKQNKIQGKTDKVFIVHGRDDYAKLEAENFLRKIGLEPIILSLMPNRGKTIMEKFIEHSDVKYALVLLTPDDVGALNGSSSQLSPRARQNVIFELGYFYGKLGRENVCCTMKSTVEIPSDILGVVYLPYENSLMDIQVDLCKEFAAAGLDFKLY